MYLGLFISLFNNQHLQIFTDLHSLTDGQTLHVDSFTKSLIIQSVDSISLTYVYVNASDIYFEFKILCIIL